MSSAKNKSHFKSILQHPVHVEHIPHMVTAVTIMYMFAFLFLSIGFLLAGTKDDTIQQKNTLVPAQQETVDFFPVEPDQQYGQADSSVNDVYLAEPAKLAFTPRFNGIVSGELLFVGFSVLAMGILVFFVNHIHDNNYFLHQHHRKISKNK